MAGYRVIFQDSGKDTRRSDTTYVRVLVWGGDRYVGAFFGLLNERSRLRYLKDQESTHHYRAMAPVALAITIKDGLERGDLDPSRDVPLHPTTVLQLGLEDREWTKGDEVLTFQIE